MYDRFATQIVAAAQLPEWFCAAITITGLHALPKRRLTPAEMAAGVEPDIRPIAVGETDLRAIGGAVTETFVTAAQEVLAPQQLAVGVENGMSILVHGIRLVLELHGDFVVVKIDIRNAYNATSRADTLRRLTHHPQLAALVPFLHACSAAGSDLIVGDGRRLFPDAMRADSSEGVQQGFPLSSLIFSVLIHPELVALDGELSPHGGCARAAMDDVYAVGPAHVVFAAVARFARRLYYAAGGEVQFSKLSCYSPQLNLTQCPFRMAAGVPVGTFSARGASIGCGIMVVGVPIGDYPFVNAFLSTKVDEVVSYIDTTVDRFHSQLRSRHALWSAVYYCCKSRFDYWLRHCLPEEVRLHVGRIDDALIAAASSLGYHGMFQDPILRTRLHLPARHGGCGIPWLYRLAAAAFAAAYIEAAETYTNPAGTGYFECLRPMFPRGAFQHGGGRFQTAIAYGPDPGSSLEALVDAWDEMTDELLRIRPITSGPFSQPATMAGAGRSTAPRAPRLQRLLTEQRQTAIRSQLHSQIMALAPDDARRRAWLSVVILSRQFISSHPDHRTEIEDTVFSEMFTTYLGAESRDIRHYAGQSIPCSRHGDGGVPCDPYGFALASATLPVTTFTECHDAIDRELWDIVSGGFQVHREPRHLFTATIPATVLAGTGVNRPSIIPDGSLYASMLPPATERGATRPRQRGQARTHHFDTKTVLGGSSDYRCPRATSGEQQAGAVAERAHRVPGDYRQHARRLDLAHHGGATVIRDQLVSLGGVRGVVFGHYSEASDDAHELLSITADELARRQWRGFGSRTQAEARGFFIQRLRRRLGLIVGREMARHRLRRIPFIGVPRAAVRAETGRRDDYAQPRQDGIQAHIFHGYQAQPHAVIAAARA